MIIYILIFGKKYIKKNLKNDFILKERICDYYDRLINQNNLEKLVKEGIFNNNIEKVIDNYISYYDKNKQSFVL